MMDILKFISQHSLTKIKYILISSEESHRQPHDQCSMGSGENSLDNYFLLHIHDQSYCHEYSLVLLLSV